MKEIMGTKKCFCFQLTSISWKHIISKKKKRQENIIKYIKKAKKQRMIHCSIFDLPAQEVITSLDHLIGYVGYTKARDLTNENWCLGFPCTWAKIKHGKQQWAKDAGKHKNSMIVHYIL